MSPDSLFPPLAPDAAAFLERYEAALFRALDLKARHRRDLPAHIRDLSHALTQERVLLREDYLRDPANRSAYLAYFLPWNLHRLLRLLPGLPLDLPDRAVLVDLGAGPLTLAQALWAARPDLRDRELTLYCVDRTKRTLGLGLDLLRQATEGAPLRWRIQLVHAPLHKALSLVPGKPDLLAALNLLNEHPWRRSQALAAQMDDLLRPLFKHLSAEGQVLFIEPGTRLGGRMISLARAAGMDWGLAPLAPCPHGGDCPLMDEGPRSWCHFNVDASDAPAWLQRLSAAAGLPKETVSLSFALLRAGAPEPGPDTDQGAARILSDPFRIPTRSGAARYGCSARGLVILYSRHDHPLRQGDLARFAWPAEPTRDSRSKALEIDLT